MQQSWLLRTLVFITLVPVLCVGCGGGETDDDPADSALAEAEANRAIKLFQSEACSVCHGETAEGVEDAGPALAGLAPYWDVDRLNAYLQDPEGFREANPDFETRRDVVYGLEMPAFDHLSEDQRRLLARWLLTR